MISPLTEAIHTKQHRKRIPVAKPWTNAKIKNKTGVNEITTDFIVRQKRRDTMDPYNIALGIIIGIYISVIIVSELFLRSNDIGNEEGTFQHFSKTGLLIYQQSSGQHIYDHKN